jgi:hypothetical protein
MHRKIANISSAIRPCLTYANVIASLALFVALGGASAFAASQLAKNSVGSRQLRSKSVTTGKIALNAVNGTKVAKGSLTGADINLAQLGTVPSAATATSAGNANTVGGHGASCPAHTTLIRGLCFDTSSTEAANVVIASEACAARGGWLPTPLELYSTKGTLNLGTGTGTDKTFTDDVYNKPGEAAYRTIVIDGAGALEEQELTASARYICVYPLVR